ncbi:hypothetical protein PRIC1_010941 [Phytophthora ramorum]|uniref:uncharacterized protein n=1 Tax=Phytophthora ramorum TaxID=164328 RepID=UPI0030B3EAFD|nr:hypothetical protein KRP23_12535 [Phytophthora ramorum]
MRFGYALLVLTTHLLTASCDAAPTATDAKSVKVVGPGPTDDNRSLRVREASNDNNNDADVNDEERTFNLKQFLGLEPSTNLFAKSKLKKMLKDENFKIEMFEKWNQQDLGAGEVALKLGMPYRTRFKKLLMQYINRGGTTATATAAKEPGKKKVTIIEPTIDDVRYFDTDAMLEWLHHFGR